MEITDDLTADDDMCRLNISLDAPLRRQDDIPRSLRLSTHIADDVTIDPQTTPKHDIALDAATMPDQRFDTFSSVFTALVPHHPPPQLSRARLTKPVRP